MCLVAAGITQGEFARRIGKSHTTLYHVLNGKGTSSIVSAEIDRFIDEHRPRALKILKETKSFSRVA